MRRLRSTTLGPRLGGVLALAILLGACADRPAGPFARSVGQSRALAASQSLADSLARAVADRDLDGTLRLACLRYALLQEALAPGDPALVSSLVDLGAAHHRSGQFERAESELRCAEALAAALPPGTDSCRANAELELGLLIKDLGRAEECRRWYEQAWHRIRPLRRRDPEIAARVAQALGQWELRWGDVMKGVRWHRLACAVTRESPRASAEARAESETWYGYALLRAGRHDEAGAQFRSAIDRLARPGQPDPPALRSALDLLAVVERGRGDAAKAEALLRRSTRLADAEMARTPGGFGAGLSHPSLRLGLVDLLLSRNRREEAFEESQVWSGWVTDAIVSGAAGAMGGRTPRESGPSHLERRLNAELRDAGNAKPASVRAALPLLAESARIEAARLAAADDHRADRTGEDRGGTDRGKVGAPAGGPILAALQTVLADDEALIGWTQANWDDDLRRGGRHVVWAYVVRRTGPVHWIQIGSWPNEAAQRTWFEDLDLFDKRLRVAAGWGMRVPADAGLDTTAAHVHAKLFAPLQPELAGVRRVLAVYQILNRWIPLECLIGPDGLPLAEHLEFAYLPSARTLVELRARPRASRASAFHALVLGDPDFSGHGDTALTDRAEVPDWTKASLSMLEPTVVRSVLAGERSTALLPRLPHALAEAREVAANLPGATLLTGARASLSRLEAMRSDGRLARFSLLHFATHALVDEAIPARSAIALAPGDGERPSAGGADPEGGLLRADEVLARWRLGADLVVLSSCQAAGGRFTWSAQSLGLAQSFLGAGSRSLLLSPWKVDDLATRALMANFSSALAEQIRREGVIHPARALRQARLSLRAFRTADGRRPFAHPVYWAGFIMVGDPGSEAEASDGR